MGKFTKAVAGVLLGLGLGFTAVHADTIVSVTETHYDAMNRPDCVAVRMNTATFGNAPANGCTLDAQGSYGPDRITHTVYDNVGQVLEVDQAYGTPIQRAYARYYYNPNGTILYEVDADNNTTQHTYDGFDRLQRTYYPCPSTQYCANSSDYEQFQYDANGNKTSWRRRNGKTLYYNYDALNREILHYVSDGSVPNVYTGYDLQGRVLYARYVSPSGSGITNIYDGLGRLTQTQDMNNRNVWWGYNEPTSVPGWFVYPDGNYIGYNLDAASRLVNVYWNGTTVLFQQSYDALGRRVGLGKGPGNAGGTVGLGYDNLGRLTGLTNDLNGTAFDVSWAFTYGPSGQIVTTNDSSTVYDYKETTASTVNNTYDDLNRDAAIAAISGGYDANGNLGNDGTRLFYYDVYNHLTGVGSAAYPQNGPYLTFTYDPLGRLASQTYYGTTTAFLYDGTNLIGEYDASGNMLERYVHDDGVDEPLVWFHGSGISDERFFIQDYHGSVIGYTDASGNLDALYKYGPYGEPKDIGNATDFAGARFRYTGQTVIPEVGLYYYKARAYDPIFGRFLQTDPIGSKDDLDLYAYTGDDPIDKTDPTGNDGVTIPVPSPLPIPFVTPTNNSLADGIQDALDNRQVKVWVTYTRYNSETGQTYSGRTSFTTTAAIADDPIAGKWAAQDQVDRRVNSADHTAKTGYGAGVLDNYAAGADGYLAIRGREQMLVDFHGGAKSDGGTSGNKIRAVDYGKIANAGFKAAAVLKFGDLPSNNPRDKKSE